jgi:hypothetical protein
MPTHYPARRESRSDEVQKRLESASDLFERLTIKIAFVRANLISVHGNNGRSFKRDFFSRASAADQPMVSNYTGFDFTGVEPVVGNDVITICETAID